MASKQFGTRYSTHNTEGNLTMAKQWKLKLNVVGPAVSDEGDNKEE